LSVPLLPDATVVTTPAVRPVAKATASASPGARRGEAAAAEAEVDRGDVVRRPVLQHPVVGGEDRRCSTPSAVEHVEAEHAGAGGDADDDAGDVGAVAAGVARPVLDGEVARDRDLAAGGDARARCSRTPGG
jgi:hypothetical protein